MSEFRPLVLRAGEEQIAINDRIRVQGSKNMTLLPDFFLVTIYNLSDEDLTPISLNKTISVYGEDGGLMCKGEIDDVYTKQNGANLLTIISAVDGKSFWETRVSKALGGGTTVKKTYQSLIQNANIGAFTADDVRMIRGQTYSGRAAECVSMLAKSVSGRAYHTNGTVYLTAKGKAAETVTLERADIIDDQGSSTGVRIVKTTVKGYPVGSFVKIDNSEFRLISQKFDTDNLEGVWDSYLILVNEKNISDGGMEGG